MGNQINRKTAVSPVFRPAFLSENTQKDLVKIVLEILEEAPLFRPVMPRTGTPFSVMMSNFGPLGWVSDRAGYRYQPDHPVTRRPWPALPPELLDIWDAAGGYATPPEACLINVYRQDARMGLHQDRDEADLAAPVVSISLGDRALFRYGGARRASPTRSAWLTSGDVVVLAGESRLAFHGIDRIVPGSSGLVPGGGRINLTLRRVTRS